MKRIVQIRRYSIIRTANVATVGYVLLAVLITLMWLVTTPAGTNSRLQDIRDVGMQILLFSLWVWGSAALVVVLFGQSMGAVAILRAVKQHGIAPDAVILEAVFDTMLNTVRNRFATMGVPSFPGAQLLVFWGGMQWGFNGFAHNPVEYARSLNCPSLFMHGSNDSRATVAEGRRVFAAVPGPKEFKEFASVGHEAYVSMHPDEWRVAVEKVIKVVENMQVNGAAY